MNVLVFRMCWNRPVLILLLHKVLRCYHNMDFIFLAHEWWTTRFDYAILVHTRLQQNIILENDLKLFTVCVRIISSWQGDKFTKHFAFVKKGLVRPDLSSGSTVISSKKRQLSRGVEKELRRWVDNLLVDRVFELICIYNFRI